MHMHPLLVAGFGAVVAAAPSLPIVVSSPILSPQSCDNNPALLVLRGLDDAASICGNLSPATQTAVATATLMQTSTETVIATVTETDAQTATDTATTVAQTTETSIVGGPTDISTNTITTTTVYGRDTSFDFLRKKNKNKKKRDKCPAKPKPNSSTYSGSLTSTSMAAPSGTTLTSSTLSSTTTSSNPLGSFPTDVISAACSCLASSTTVTDIVTVTTTVAATPPVTSTAHVTVSPTVATEFVTITSGTNTATATSTAPGLTTTVETHVPAPTPATVTVTVTTTQAAAAVATTTVTATSPYFRAYLAQPAGNAIPITRRQVFQDVPDIPLTIDGIVQFCATQCVADSGCVRIWIAYNDPITQDGLWCVTGGAQDNFGQLQNNYPGIGAAGEWFEATSPESPP
ncbi:hypothetical protein PG984_005046 [Apiospora sp. TS-2023a]